MHTMAEKLRAHGLVTEFRAKLADDLASKKVQRECRARADAACEQVEREMLRERARTSSLEAFTRSLTRADRAEIGGSVIAFWQGAQSLREAVER